MNVRLLTASLLASCCLRTVPAHAQSADTLSKIKVSGVINLGGRDTSFPFS